MKTNNLFFLFESCHVDMLLNVVEKRNYMSLGTDSQSLQEKLRVKGNCITIRWML